MAYGCEYVDGALLAGSTLECGAGQERKKSGTKPEGREENLGAILTGIAGLFNGEYGRPIVLMIVVVVVVVMVIRL